MLAGHPASFLLAELTARNLKPLLERMAQLPRVFPQARLAVVADRALQSREWLMREAGAVHFAVSPRDLALLAGVACRHLDQVPKPHRTITEQIWAGLPWRASRDAGISNRR